MYNKITAPTASDKPKQSELFYLLSEHLFQRNRIHKYAAKRNTNVRIIFLQYILHFHLFGHGKIFLAILHDPQFLFPGKIPFNSGRTSHYQ